MNSRAMKVRAEINRNSICDKAELMNSKRYETMNEKEILILAIEFKQEFEKSFLRISKELGVQEEGLITNPTSLHSAWE